MNKEYKPLAIKLREQGKTYSEIMQKVPVAKSTLCEWFKSVDLARPQKQRITKARIAGALRGAEARRTSRLKEIENLNTSGRKEVGKLTKRELWLIGTALHWAEGSKQRESSLSAGVMFTNSDPDMLSVFLAWLREMNITEKDLIFELYVHDSRKSEVPVFKKWWTQRLGISPIAISFVYFKRDKILTNRKNTADLYHGLIRIKVRASTSLNRQINGWIQGIVNEGPIPSSPAIVFCLYISSSRGKLRAEN
jgi:hypothetical protein